MAKSPGRNLYRRGPVYWARVQIAGRDVRQSLRTSDRAEALKRLTAILKDAERIRFGEDARHRYEEAVVAWAESGFGGEQRIDGWFYTLSDKGQRTAREIRANSTPHVDGVASDDAPRSADTAQDIAE